MPRVGTAGPRWCVPGQVTQAKEVRELFYVKWAGFDYGETLMDPSGLRNHLLWGDTCKSIGRPELTADKVKAYRQLREAYGEYHTVKEGHRHEVYEHVLAGDDRAQRAFMEAEPRLLMEGDGLKWGLRYLRDEGIVLDIVSELKGTVGPIGENVILRFLRAHGLASLFRFLITPLGKIDVATGRIIDDRYRGHTKEEGTLFDVLVEDLAEQGVKGDEAVMVGDRPAFDIQPARARGLLTIQYVGYVDLPSGTPAARPDARIGSFAELPGLVAGWEQRPGGNGRR